MTVMLYKSPGKEHLPQHGGWFELLVVDEGDVAERCAEGWKLTPADALEAMSPRIKKIDTTADIGAYPVTGVFGTIDKSETSEPKPKRRYTRKKAAE